MRDSLKSRYQHFVTRCSNHSKVSTIKISWRKRINHSDVSTSWDKSGPTGTKYHHPVTNSWMFDSGCCERAWDRVRDWIFSLLPAKPDPHRSDPCLCVSSPNTSSLFHFTNSFYFSWSHGKNSKRAGIMDPNLTLELSAVLLYRTCMKLYTGSLVAY